MNMRRGGRKKRRCVKLARDSKGRYVGRAKSIPPAYTNVCLSADPSDRLQWTGVDNKGRTQYGYSRVWRKQQSDLKYDKLLHTGRVISAIRKWVSRELLKEVTNPIAIIIGTADHCRMRAGATRYTRSSGNRGATTLLPSDFRAEPPMLTWNAKGGRERKCQIKSLPLARKIPNMFENTVHVNKVNAWLSEKYNGITLKDFRTWHANAVYLKHIIDGASHRESVSFTAKNMGHTDKTCMSHYLDPFVIERASRSSSGMIYPSLPGSLLSDSEQCLVRMLQQK